MNRVAIKPELVQCAPERAQLAIDDLTTRFPRLADRERGEAMPTYRQLEDFAKATQAIRAAKEGRIGFGDAYRLTGLHGGAFQQYAKRLGLKLP